MNKFERIECLITVKMQKVSHFRFCSTNKNVLFPFATNYHILKKEKTDPRLISEITSFFFKKRPEIITFKMYKIINFPIIYALGMFLYVI